MKSDSRPFRIIAQFRRRCEALSPRLGIALVAVWLAVLAGCRDASRAGDRSLQWDFNRVWSVGGTSDNRVSLSLLYPFEVASDGSGRLYILDGPGHRIIVVGSDGRIIDSLGREGQGSGEFKDPWAIAVTANEIAAVDPATRRIVRWTPDGQLLEPVPIRDALWDPKIEFSSGNLLYTTDGPTGGGHEQHLLIASGPSGKDTLATLPKQQLRMGDFPSCHATGIGAQPLFAPTIHWDAAFDRIAVNAEAAYVIEMFQGSKHVGTISRPIQPAPADRAAAERAAQDWRFNGCLVPPDEVIRTTGFLDVIPVIESLALSPTGELWVLRSGERGDSSIIDILESTGDYAGSLPAGAPFPAVFLPGDRIASIEKDSLDVPRVSVYDIRRGGS